MIGLGAHIDLDDDWLLMVGTSYVSSAVDNADRTPDLPVDQQVRASIGAEYRIDDTWRIGANYTFLWLGENDIDQTRPFGRITGDYDAYGHLFGIYGTLGF